MSNSPYSDLQYSRNQVRIAGNALIGKAGSHMNSEEVYRIVNNWRDSHRYPLSIGKQLLTVAAVKVDQNAIIVDRIKRLQSIETKLKMFPRMNLTTMQDLGGCRAIVEDRSKVQLIVSDIRSKCSEDDDWECTSYKDYILEPKEDGYRGIHLVYKYNKQPFGGLRIEIQVRTVLQHTWATALEVVSLFTDQDLKRQKGRKDWKRFFLLASNLLGALEYSPPVRDSPEKFEDYVPELAELWSTLKVEYFLAGLTGSLTSIEENLTSAKFYVLELDTKTKSVSTFGFTEDELPDAWRFQTTLETKHRDSPHVDVVMVFADSLMELKKGYPNYFLDTARFLGLLADNLTPIIPHEFNQYLIDFDTDD